ncbi:hypothetical protein Droror1_Dr00009025 [Drosera rotundifolia]
MAVETCKTLKLPSDTKLRKRWQLTKTMAAHTTRSGHHTTRNVQTGQSRKQGKVITPSDLHSRHQKNNRSALTPPDLHSQSSRRIKLERKKMMTARTKLDQWVGSDTM